MLEIWVEFNLVHRWDDRGGFENRLQVTLQEVGYTDGTGFSSCLDLFHRSPGGLELALGLRKERGMDQVPYCAISTVSTMSFSLGAITRADRITRARVLTSRRNRFEASSSLRQWPQGYRRYCCAPWWSQIAPLEGAHILESHGPILPRSCRSLPRQDGDIRASLPSWPTRPVPDRSRCPARSYTMRSRCHTQAIYVSR